MLISTGEVLSHKKYGDHYHSLTIVAPEIGEQIQPGQFVNIRCGDDRSYILRRPFSVYRVQKRGTWASTIEIVFDVRGLGSGYLSSLREYASVDLVGPLGRGFTVPNRRAHCLLIGGGIGATPIFFLADELRQQGHRVDIILGARNIALLLNPIEARRISSVCRITTDDGSRGTKGRVTDVLFDMVDTCQSDVVYACGPHPMLAAVSAACNDQDVPVQVAVEELMACGYGVCMTCVLPVRTGEGVVYARSCTEGPVFNGADVVWETAVEPVGREEKPLAVVGHDEIAPPGN